MFSVAHEMWRLASIPPAPLIFGAMLLVLAWSVAFRKQDAEAWVMCATLVALWGVELFMKAILDAEAFRGLVAVSDTVCAFVALKLGARHQREYLLIIYATLVYAILLHVLWLFGVFQVYGKKNDYIALLNVLLAVRLSCIAFPGVVHVGKVLGAFLPPIGPGRSAVHQKVSR